MGGNQHPTPYNDNIGKLNRLLMCACIYKMNFIYVIYHLAYVCTCVRVMITTQQVVYTKSQHFCMYSKQWLYVSPSIFMYGRGVVASKTHPSNLISFTVDTFIDSFCTFNLKMNHE